MDLKQEAVRRDRWLIVSAACLAFAAVYERFSHQVYSPWMVFAFAVPLLGGAVPCLLRGKRRRGTGGPWSRAFWDSGIAALTVGSLFRGALEIYGTTSRYGKVFWILGGALLLAGLTAEIAEKAPPGGAAP